MRLHESAGCEASGKRAAGLPGGAKVQRRRRSCNLVESGAGDRMVTMPCFWISFEIQC